MKEQTTKIIEDLKAENKRIGDELVENKLNYTKELALKDHSENHLKGQLEKLESRIKQMTDDSEDRLRRIREEATAELKANETKIMREKTAIEEKYEKLKKSSRENENISKKEIS